MNVKNQTYQNYFELSEKNQHIPTQQKEQNSAQKTPILMKMERIRYSGECAQFVPCFVKHDGALPVIHITQLHDTGI